MRVKTLPTLFTIGYEKRSIAEYVELLRAAKIDVLVDVRETAWSHKAGFSKSALSAALATVGIEYVHAKFAGNPKTLRANALTHADCLAAYADLLEEESSIVEQFEELVASLITAGKRACITCFERHPGDCHRGILAERWSGRGKRRVEHLSPDGCARLVS